MKILYIKSIFLFFAFAICSYFLFAQPITFKQLTVEKGLSQSSVNVMGFDKIGFLWAGTADGLNKYDGYTFTQYRNSGQKNQRIFNTGITLLICDGNNKIWLGGNDGIEVLNPTTNISIKLLSINCPLNLSSIYHDTVAKKMVLFVLNTGIWEIDENTFQVKKITDGKNLICQNIYGTSFIRNGDELQIFFRLKKSIFTYHLKTHTITVESFLKNSSDKILTSTSILPNGNAILAATINNKDYLVEYNKSKKLIVRQKEVEKLTLDPFYKNCLYIKSINKIIVNDYFKGLIFYDTAFNKTGEYPIASLQTSSEKHINFLHLLDKDNSLWMSCDPLGIVYCNLTATKFSHFKNGKSGISSMVKGIFTNSHNDVYSCLLNEGVQIFDKNGNYKNDLEKIGCNNTALFLQGFNTILPLDRNEVFLNCQNYTGLYNTETKQVKNLKANFLLKINENVNDYTDLYYAAGKINNYTFLISHFKELWKLDFESKVSKIELIDTLPNSISCIFPLSETKYFVGTESGLYLINNGLKTLYPQTIDLLIKNINYDGKQFYWMSTPTGLWQIDKNLRIIKHFTSDDGLPNNFCYGTLPSANNLWISTNYGLSNMDLTTQKFTNYTVADGVQSNEFNSGAFWKSDEGAIYFGGVNGITKVNDAVEVPTSKINTLITQLKINDKDYSDSIAAWNINKLQLTYKENTIFFEFAGMEPSLSQQITYRYMLEGVDKDWVYIGKNRNVRYGGLQPGSYVFKVSCSLNNKDWLSKVTEIEININPPFWKTWWFITLVGITLIGFLFLFVQQYNKRKYQKKLDSLKALQQLEEERQRISRDLHDNMGAYTSALLNNVQQLKNKTGENEDLIKMKSNADQILSSLRETIWVLNNKSVTVKEFSGSFKNYCFNILRNFDNIDFDTSENIENNKTLPAASTIHLTKILQEAFQNIIKHADATKVTYNITSIDKIEIRLIDNGTGFETNTIEKGNGINNMNWRAKEVGFSINLISTKEIGTTINLKEL